MAYREQGFLYSTPPRSQQPVTSKSFPAVPGVPADSTSTFLASPCPPILTSFAVFALHTKERPLPSSLGTRPHHCPHSLRGSEAFEDSSLPI